MTTFLPLSSRTNLDPAALAHLTDFWTAHALRHAGEYDKPDGAYAAAYSAGLGGDEEVQISPYVAFAEGFKVAMKIAAAVIADPFGDPKSPICEAVNAARADIEEQATHSRVMVLDKSEVERLSATAPSGRGARDDCLKYVGEDSRPDSQATE